ncbi:uncharacterized protein LOC110266947 [Arachis ipaensis]|uniref:uncharacterized protein LOC110266947 n=1 Tax=Arachis ipaensis TaxID=130454 RepID=UPI000A2B8C96|nr:uncharacterized protein LOC110266947 [Arachis ipaensis]
METGKLRWVRQRQKELRAELYQGLQDALHTGENNAENVGRRTILPSSFVGSRRDMTQRLVRAEIPCKETEPHLHEAVLRNMVHGPCGTLNQSSPCMKNGQCKRNYPKEFVPETRRGDDSYPQYRKRFDTPIPINQNVTIDNRWVVPYNPWLLLKYDCHINVEICSSIKSIKYLYKYCYKGPDRVAMEVHRSSHYDEVQQFIDARWIAALEACWRIFRFNLYRMYPSVERLQVHLPNQHQVSFYEHQTISEIVNNDYFSRTMLTEFFALNRADDQQSRHLLYREIPEYYSWHSKEKEWHRRRTQKRAIGRIYTVSPTEGEKFYLRILLSNVRGPTGWDDLLTVDGVQYSSFKQSAQHRGLLESNSSIRSCLVEASILRMPCALRRLFATILIFCEPTDVRSLWDEFLSCMVDDYASTSTTTCNGLTNRLLRDLNDILLQHGKHIAQYDLPALTSDNDNDNFMSRIIQEEMSIEVPQEDLCSIERLNHDQSAAFRCIMNTIDRRESGVFFVDGPGGAGKTFLYRAIIADLRSKGHIVLVTASSEIAATLLPGGRTAHSRFKIPINAEPSSTCNISKQSDLAKLIRQTTAIIWDEVPLTNKETMESLDRTLRDILENNNPFGGKVMVMGGNFCQVLPVVPKGSKSQMISASIVKSHLWAFTKIFHLRQNMRSLNDRDFAEYLMRIGDGIEPTICEDLVQIEVGMAIPWEGEASLHKLIEETFPILQSHGWDASYMVERAILTPKNHDVQQLNDIFINQFPGDERILASFDEVEGDTNNLYQQEYLNSISTGGFPPHMLKETGFQSLWNTWKDEQSIASMRPIDNKVHPIKIYSIGWGGTVKADKTQLWKMEPRSQESSFIAWSKAPMANNLGTTTVTYTLTEDCCERPQDSNKDNVDRVVTPKEETKWNDDDKKKVELNAKAINLLHCAISFEERLRRLMKNKGKYKGSSSKEYNKDMSKVICHNCKEARHFKYNCPKLKKEDKGKKEKKRVLMASWEDLENDSDEEEDSECEAQICFMAGEDQLDEGKEGESKNQEKEISGPSKSDKAAAGDSAGDNSVLSHEFGKIFDSTTSLDPTMTETAPKSTRSHEWRFLKNYPQKFVIGDVS